MCWFNQTLSSKSQVVISLLDCLSSRTIAFKSSCCVIPELHHPHRWLIIAHEEKNVTFRIPLPREDGWSYSPDRPRARSRAFLRSRSSLYNFSWQIPVFRQPFFSTTPVPDGSHCTLCRSWLSTILFSWPAIVTESLQDEFIFSWLWETRPLCVLYRNRQWFITCRQRHIALSTHPLRHTRGWSWLITKVSNPKLSRLNSPGATWKRRWMDLRDTLLSFCQTHLMRNTQTTTSNSGRCLAAARPFRAKVHSADLQWVATNF